MTPVQPPFTNLWSKQTLMHSAFAILDPASGNALSYRELRGEPKTNPTWTRSMTRELGHLGQGVSDAFKGTVTFFSFPTKSPCRRHNTYG
jgi:hypothetical protein